MAEEPENHTLRLLREMRADIEASREENKRLHAETRAELRADIALIGEALKKTGEAVTSIAAVQQEHTAVLMEHSTALRALMKHTGLVKA